MTEPARDRWAEQLLERRDGGDPELKRASLDFIAPVRDRELDNADLSDGEILLDVGAGDGLISFGAVELVGADGRVIFGDASQYLLERSRALAEESALINGHTLSVDGGWESLRRRKQGA